MPFDGLDYRHSTAPAAQSSLWARLTAWVLGTPRVTKPPASWAFEPIPADHPNALTVQVLTAGRALIEDRKDWVQRRYETRDGRRCAVGALRGVARIMNLHESPIKAQSILLSVAMGRGFNDIESMNDNSSHQQVLSAFDEAIAKARQLPG
jgi:hypothetical protein